MEEKSPLFTFSLARPKKAPLAPSTEGIAKSLPKSHANGRGAREVELLGALDRSFVPLATGALATMTNMSPRLARRVLGSLRRRGRVDSALWHGELTWWLLPDLVVSDSPDSMQPAQEGGLDG